MRIRKIANSYMINGNVNNELSTSTTDTYSCNYINNIISQTLLAAHPVNSYYMTDDSTNPSDLFGGTWEQITGDAYLKIVTSDAGQLGGTSSDHKIPLSSIPSHTHGTAGYTNTANTGSMYYKYAVGANSYGSSNTQGAGGGQAYYPYYLGIYLWKRTA